MREALGSGGHATVFRAEHAELHQQSGHRAEAMLDVYDHEIPVVDSAASSLQKKPKKA